MWKWESFSKQIKQSLCCWERAAGWTVSWRHTPMTSLPLSVWQLSTSSQWQPDECNEWVVTLATAMLSWLSPYILPDSPCWRWAQHTRTKQCTHPHTYSRTLCQAHVHILYLSLSILYEKPTLKPSLKPTLRQCTCPHTLGPLGIIMWYTEEYNLPWCKTKCTEDAVYHNHRGETVNTLSSKIKKRNS